MEKLTPPVIPIEVFKIDTDYAEKQYVGDYLHCKVGFAWSIPAMMVFKVPEEHHCNEQFEQCRRKVVPVRARYHGEEFAGRVVDVEIDWDGERNGPGSGEVWTVYCVSNLFWLMVVLAWVNPGLPAEVQVGLTGKQDVMIGPPDWVFKWYLTRNMIRADRPVYSMLPVRYDVPELPTLDELTDLDELLEYLNGFDIIGLSARFPTLNDLYKQTVEATEMGMTMDLVVPDEYIAQGREMPKVFNTDGLGQLQSILDYTSDYFLDLSKLVDVAVSGLWTDTITEPGYVFHTHEKRDRRQMVWQVRGGNIARYKRKISHARGSHAIVGGKAPEAMNQLIEFAANMAVQAIAAAVTTALGLPGLGAVAVGSLFDDIFFAFQHFFDSELEESLGRHGFKEGFADNTSAWSLDAFAVGQALIKKLSGDDTLTFDAISGTGEGFEFGADTELFVIDGELVEVDMSHKRYRHGDIMTFYHRGTMVENFVSLVEIEDRRDGRVIEHVTFGNMKQLDALAMLMDKVGQFASISQGFAVSA